MSKDKLLAKFRDISEERKIRNDAVSFMTRYWVPQPAHRVKKVLTPAQLKYTALHDTKLDEALSELSIILQRPKDELKKEVATMLEEIGLDRKLYVVRWLGVVTTKLICRMYTSILVNEKAIFEMKRDMGLNPIVFVPTHRSYCDFILMSYISFYYDMELPACAAGMDFHAMVGMGSMMRNTGAFYMRRSFATDQLYSTVFKQYVRTLVLNYQGFLEFFIEGTRSRSGKSMAPKYGFMSMVLEPLFSGDLPDITFIPIHISYDKVLEDRLFAFELLGVPKPKESTAGLLKSINFLMNFFGKIFVNIGEPVSAKEYIRQHHKKTVRENIKPTDSQKLTPEQNYTIQGFSHEIITKQQEIAIVTTFQMIAAALTISLHARKPLSESEVFDYVTWLSQVLKSSGGIVLDYDADEIRKEISDALLIHKNLVKTDKDKKLRLINTEPFILTDEVKAKMKGHVLSVDTINIVIPVVMIQLYMNPILHWIISAALIDLILDKFTCSKDVLFDFYKRLRQLLRYEFPVNELTLDKEFDRGLEFLLEYNASIESSPGIYKSEKNEQLHELLSVAVWPFITCSYRTAVCLVEKTSVEEKEALKNAQQALEWHLTKEQSVHPYCLSLDCILNSIQGLVLAGGLKKERRDNKVYYNINCDQLNETCEWLKELLPDIQINFDHNNPVMVNQIVDAKQISKL